MGVRVGELNHVPVARGLGDLVGDGRARGAEEEHLLRGVVNDVEEGLEAHAGIAL